MGVRKGRGQDSDDESERPREREARPVKEPNQERVVSGNRVRTVHGVDGAINMVKWANAEKVKQVRTGHWIY